MDETDKQTSEAISKLIELGMSVERIAERLDLDIEFLTVAPIFSFDD